MIGLGPAVGEAEALDRAGRLTRLMTLFSPAFPIGGFAWSHGLETAIGEGWVKSADDVISWLACLIERGSGWNDCVLAAEAFNAETTRDTVRLEAVASLALALAGSFERREETSHLGAAFLEAAHPYLADTRDVPRSGNYPYPVATGLVTARASLPIEEALVAFTHGFVAQLVSAAVRLVPLGQRDHVRVLHALEPTIRAVAARAATSTLDDLGSAALGSEIAAMRHETLQPRLFRS